MTMTIRTYSELILLPTFKERFEYLRLDGKVGEDTFGFDRYLNQLFYRSQEWRKIRDYVIVRDNACDLGVEGYDICMAGFILGNTLSDNGAVTRGVCVLDEAGHLVGVNETGGIIKYNGGAACEKDGVITPIDALKVLEKEGVYGSLHPHFYTTVGTGTTEAEAARMAKEIIPYLQEDHVDGVIMAST